MFLTFITRERFYILIFKYFWTAKIGIQKQCSLERRNDFKPPHLQFLGVFSVLIFLRKLPHCGWLRAGQLIVHFQFALQSKLMRASSQS